MAQDDKFVTQNTIDLLYFGGCALRGETPTRERLEASDIAGVFELASSHYLLSLLWPALSTPEAQALMGDDLAREWGEYANKMLMRTALFDIEYESLDAWLTEKGYWHLPFKGIVTKSLYPDPSMREMSDIDILVDEAARRDLRTYLIDQGYSNTSYGENIHDTYLKKPVYNIEVHHELIIRGRHPQSAAYFGDIRKRLVPDPNNPLRLSLTPRDSYLYTIAHAQKHIDEEGIGLRVIFDIWTWCHNGSISPTSASVQEALSQLDLRTTENALREISEKALVDGFTPDQLSAEAYELLIALNDAGAYGNVTTLYQRNVAEAKRQGSSRAAYIMKRLFPPMEWYKNYAPFVYKHKWTIPFFVVYRLGSMAFSPTRRARAKSELDEVNRQL